MQQYNQEELQASIAKLSRLGGDKARMITDLFLSSSPLALHLQHGLAKRGSSIRRALTGKFEEAGNDMKARFTGLSDEAVAAAPPVEVFSGIEHNAIEMSDIFTDDTLRGAGFHPLPNPNPLRSIFTPGEGPDLSHQAAQGGRVQVMQHDPQDLPDFPDITNAGVAPAASEAGGSSEATAVEDTATAAAKDVAKSTGSDLELAGEVADDTGIGTLVGGVLAVAGVISDLVGLFETHKAPPVINPGFQAGI